MAKQNNYFRLEMLVLKILESEDRYGYQIVQDIYAQSDHMIAVQEGTLYPVLTSCNQRAASAATRYRPVSGACASIITSKTKAGSIWQSCLTNSAPGPRPSWTS